MSEEKKATAPESNQSPTPAESETEDEGLDPRVLIVVGVIVLIIVFFYWRKASSTQDPAEEKGAGSQTQAARQQQQQQPPMTFRDLVLLRRSVTSQSLFVDGDRFLILATPPAPLQQSEDGKQVKASPGTFFDISKRAEGIQALEFVRRMLGPQLDQPAFANTVPPLGYMDQSPKPVFKKAAEATMQEVTPDDAVFAFESGGAAKAYPLKFLRFYDIINDDCGGAPVVAVYNGVGGATTVFSRQSGDKALRFGSSGLLFRSANLMYDDATRSLWSGVSGQAVAGARTGSTLTPLPSVVTRLSVWLKSHPGTLVMTAVEPATNIEYGHDYATGMPEYHSSAAIIYPLDGYPQTPQIHPKTVVFGVIGPKGAAKAYAAEEVAAKGRVEDTLGGAKVTLVYDREGICAQATGPDGKPLPCVMSYWMCWVGAFPKTEYSGPAPQPPPAAPAEGAPAEAKPAAPVPATPKSAPAPAPTAPAAKP